MRAKRVVLAGVAVLGLLGVVAGGLYATNRAPAVTPISDDDARSTDRPFVIKLHAQWCPACMVTKDVWAQVQQTYGGRAHLVVFDFTNDETTAAAEVEARRLGLEPVFHEYSGATGFVVIFDGRAREVAAEVSGRDFDAYRTAIDAALVSAPTSGSRPASFSARLEGIGRRH